MGATPSWWSQGWWLVVGWGLGCWSRDGGWSFGWGLNSDGHNGMVGMVVKVGSRVGGKKGPWLVVCMKSRVGGHRGWWVGGLGGVKVVANTVVKDFETLTKSTRPSGIDS